MTMELRTEDLDRLGEKETPTNLINLVRRGTKGVPGGGKMWSAYLRLLETYEGEESKDLETMPGE